MLPVLSKVGMDQILKQIPAQKKASKRMSRGELPVPVVSRSAMRNPCYGPCGPEPQPLPPIYGRFGCNFNPDKKPKTQGTSKTNSKSKSNKLPSIQKAKKEPTYLDKFPSFEPQAKLACNIMWDPHVYRGRPICHFATLENACKYVPKRRSRWKKSSQKVVNPLLDEKTGSIIYPPIKLAGKQELTDFSQFLEEQDDQELSLEDRFKDCVAQTEPEDQLTEESEDRHISNWRSDNNQTVRPGMAAETQVDYFRLSQDMRYTVNPRQHTINRISKIMACQMLNQGLLETMECAEMALIQAECEKLEFWMKVEQRKRFQDRRDYCKKLQKFKERQAADEEIEKRMKFVEARIKVGMFADYFTKMLFERGFQQMVEEGVVPNPNSGGEQGNAHPEIQKWLQEGLKVGRAAERSKAAFSMLDIVLEDVAEQRMPNGNPELPLEASPEEDLENGEEGGNKGENEVSPEEQEESRGSLETEGAGDTTGKGGDQHDDHTDDGGYSEPGSKKESEAEDTTPPKKQVVALMKKNPLFKPDSD